MQDRTLKIYNVVRSTLEYEIYFEEILSDGRTSLSLPCTWFRTIGAPKPGMKLRMEQTENGSFFYLDGKLLGSPKTQLSLPAEEQAKILERQRKAEERVAKAKKRKERLALA